MWLSAAALSPYDMCLQVPTLQAGPNSGYTGHYSRTAHYGVISPLHSNAAVAKGAGLDPQLLDPAHGMQTLGNDFMSLAMSQAGQVPPHLAAGEISLLHVTLSTRSSSNCTCSNFSSSAPEAAFVLSRSLRVAKHVADLSAYRCI